MPMFRKKPVVIEARQFDGSPNGGEYIRSWVGNGARVVRHNGAPAVIIPTLEGDHRAEAGDWIIKGVAGEFYPCKPDIFEKTYEAAE